MKHLAYILILFQFNFVHSQQNNSKEHYSKVFDTKIGISNTSLFQGLEYVEEYPMDKDKHRFFHDFNFIIGAINFGGQDYYDVLLKYDVFGDQILLKASEITGTSAILLDKKKVRNFSIGSHHFINITTENSNFKNGFYEILASNKIFTIYKKHKKKMNKKLDKSYAYYSFKDKYDYFVFYKNEYSSIKSPKNLASIFKNQKDIVKNSYKKYKASNKNNKDEIMILCAEDLFNHLTTKVN